MLKNLKLVIIVLLTFVSLNSFAGENIPPDTYKDSKQEFNYVYKVAHESTRPWAQYKLGKYFELGYGTSPDILQAYVWYRLAALNQTEPAAIALENLKTNMSSEQIKQANSLYLKTRDKLAMGAINQIRNFNMK